MNTGGIRDFGIRAPLPEPKIGRADGGAAPTQGPSFGQALDSALKEVDGDLQKADGQAASYVAGENVDLHTVMLDLERADLGFRTMVQVRNKLLDAYKEVMRLPV